MRERDGLIETRDACFSLDPREMYLDFGDIRKASRKYIKDEIQWYLSEENVINNYEMIRTNKIWSEICSDKFTVNSNYGELIFSDKYYRQYDNAMKKLEINKFSKQSVCIYNRPEMQIQWNDNINAKKDFICTMYTQHFIENNDEFTYIVYMRSCDMFYGLQNDYNWHRYIYYRMLDRLQTTYPNLKEGKIIWHAGSLHVYDKHRDVFMKIMEVFNDDRTRKSNI